MLFSAYDSNALRVLNAALVEALATLDKSAARDLTGEEKAYSRNKVARNLMEA